MVELMVGLGATACPNYQFHHHHQISFGLKIQNLKEKKKSLFLADHDFAGKPHNNTHNLRYTVHLPHLTVA